MWSDDTLSLYSRVLAASPFARFSYVESQRHAEYLALFDFGPWGTMGFLGTMDISMICSIFSQRITLSDF